MRAGLWTAAILVSALSVVSCSKGSPASPSSTGAFIISVIGEKGNLSFSPNPADAGGKSVVFKNTDTVTHRVVLNDGSIDTGDIGPGATSNAVNMPSGGTNYHCAIHANMGGAVEPQSGGEPPACVGIYCY